MSVFTPVSQVQLETLLTEYSIGQLTQFEGIDGGTDNSNYFVDTTTGRFVLTLFERLTVKQLPFFLSLGDQLADNGCSVAHPIHDNSGIALKDVAGKPAVLFERLTGKHLGTPSIIQCQQMGGALADVHAADLNLQDVPENQFGLTWIKQFQDYTGWQDPEDPELFREILYVIEKLDQLDLPRGVIHADLFHDNALFVQDKLSGIIDWYFACNDWLLLDLAIMINDWCLDGSIMNVEKSTALIEAYNARRTLTAKEVEHLNAMQLLAACRFWLSRTLAWSDLKHEPQSGITIKPPGEMKDLIRQLL